MGPILIWSHFLSPVIEKLWQTLYRRGYVALKISLFNSQLVTLFLLETSCCLTFGATWSWYELSEPHVGQTALLLTWLGAVACTRRCVLAREMTKYHEEVTCRLHNLSSALDVCLTCCSMRDLEPNPIFIFWKVETKERLLRAPCTFNISYAGYTIFLLWCMIL